MGCEPSQHTLHDNYLLKALRPEIEITLVRSGIGPAWPEQQLAHRVVKTSAEAISAGVQAAIICSPAPFHVPQAQEWLKEGRSKLGIKWLEDMVTRASYLVSYHGKICHT